MNRAPNPTAGWTKTVPRERGDEPLYELKKARAIARSPRARG